MNDVERLQIKLDGLAQVVRKLEQFFEPYRLQYSDVQEAERVARDAGLDTSILRDPQWPDRCERGRLLRIMSQVLRQSGWSASRIARALNCSERTVERHWGRGVRGQSGNPPGLSGQKPD